MTFRAARMALSVRDGGVEDHDGPEWMRSIMAPKAWP